MASARSMSARSSSGGWRLGSTCAQEWWATSWPAARIASHGAGNDSIVWPGMKKVAGSSSRARNSSSRGTPTRAPYSPRCNMAGVTCSIAEPHRHRVEVERQADGGAGHGADRSVLLGQRARWTERGDRVAMATAPGHRARPTPTGVRVDLGGALRRARASSTRTCTSRAGRSRGASCGCSAARSLAEALERVEAADEARRRAGCAGAAGATSCGRASSRRARRSTRSPARQDRAARARRPLAVGQLGGAALAAEATAAAPRAREVGEPTASCARSRRGTSSTPSPRPAAGDARRDARGAAGAHAAGVTGVHDKDGGRGAPELFAALRDAGELTLRVWQSVPDAYPTRGSYVKAFMDGTLGSRTARLLDGSGCGSLSRRRSPRSSARPSGRASARRARDRRPRQPRRARRVRGDRRT